MARNMVGWSLGWASQVWGGGIPGACPSSGSIPETEDLVLFLLLKKENIGIELEDFK